MTTQLEDPQSGKPYGQRAQAETVMSMLKRNLGDAGPHPQRDDPLGKGRDRAGTSPLRFAIARLERISRLALMGIICLPTYCVFY